MAPPSRSNDGSLALVSCLSGGYKFASVLRCVGLVFFTPQPLRAVWVLFLSMVSTVSGWAVRRQGKSLSGLYLTIVRCRKFRLGRDIGRGCRCATLWCDLDLNFDLAAVSMSLKILFGLYLGNRKVVEVDTWWGH